MLREKLVTTAIVATAVIAAAMGADYLLSIVVLNDPAGYTPLVTLAISTLLTYPVTFALVSGRVQLRIARDELAEARDTALEASRVKSEFLANMSHELRTPLNAILGFSDMLRSDIFAERRIEYANLIHDSGTHLLGLVNDLLDLSRIEAGQLELHEEDIDPALLIDECLTIVKPHAANGQLMLTRSVDAELPLLFADHRALKQILLNLLTNAIKFTPPGRSVEAFCRPGADGGVVMGVRDEGIGIEPEEQARMFERFGQSHHDIAQALKGTGLGLPIVKGLAEAHGGHVTMQSAPGEGTCMTIYLPQERIRLRHQRAAA